MTSCENLVPLQSQDNSLILYNLPLEDVFRSVQLILAQWIVG